MQHVQLLKLFLIYFSLSLFRNCSVKTTCVQNAFSIFLYYRISGPFCVNACMVDFSTLYNVLKGHTLQGLKKNSVIKFRIILSHIWLDFVSNISNTGIILYRIQHGFLYQD
uniref:Putative ovule protein n=1 Tax=Solanum chacoense TaxID=4108 RepID=A0A0V0GPK2_SOLCH